MIMKFLIVKNISREGPGLIQKVLNKRKISFEEIDLTKGAEFPNLKDVNAIIVLGGPQSANDQEEVMLNEIQKVKQIISEAIPYLGVCLGMQVLGKAAGAEVYQNPFKEIGFKGSFNYNYHAWLSEEGKKDPLFKNIESPFKVFQLHGETVSLKPGVKTLAMGTECFIQAIKVGEVAYGLQFHVELTKEMLGQWHGEDADLSKISEEKLLQDWQEVEKEYEKTGMQIISNFIEIAKNHQAH